MDKKILRPIYEHLKESGEPFAVMVMPDHFTPISVRTHTREPVPFLMYHSQKALGGGRPYNEKSAAESGIYYPEASALMRDFLKVGDAE